ncbi:hypothetical protein AAFF_G00094980 [Aldrovandia affinis]|uniref:Uncharacterized protein n=1 Tax=Aldrovandia affinis TaxID=143900 RepID=A0AAD7RVL2_9TELE|nr:hypothetical protein AAFF_G00094980 [Aldrovandia affinis]
MCSPLLEERGIEGLSLHGAEAVSRGDKSQKKVEDNVCWCRWVLRSGSAWAPAPSSRSVCGHTAIPPYRRPLN